MDIPERRQRIAVLSVDHPREGLLLVWQQWRHDALRGRRHARHSVALGQQIVKEARD